MLQIALGVGGLVVSLLLAWALVAATRRQTAHFRSLVTSSTDLVLVLGDGGCRYVSASVERSACRPQSRARPGRNGHPRLRPRGRPRRSRRRRSERATPQQLVFRMRNAAGEWRHLEAHLTDLRSDRHVRGVVLNARDITERVRLEQELTRQAQRDNFGSQLVEALEMADEEAAAYDVVERAMVEIASDTPMELLLSDSSRAHLDRRAVQPARRALRRARSSRRSPASPCGAAIRSCSRRARRSTRARSCATARAGPCSAVCVPISFMGRSLGVLHATGPDGEPPSTEQVAQLTTLATQAGARIGTVRAFEKTQLQAPTDGAHRADQPPHARDGAARACSAKARPFALALADLDHFKQLNDTHGHEAGDRALRLFSHVVRRCCATTTSSPAGAARSS